MAKGFYMSYGTKVYELREFKKGILEGVPSKYRKNLSEMMDHILLYSAKYNVDPVLVVSTIWTETAFNKDAISPKGAAGAMQIMKDTGKYIFERILKKDKSIDRFNLEHNIEAGIAYIAYLQKKFNGNEEHSMIAYNMGPGYVLKRKTAKFNHQYWNKIKARTDKISASLEKRGKDVWGSHRVKN